MHQTINLILKRSVAELDNAGICSPELDARVLLKAAIDKKTACIFAHPEAPMCNADYARFRRYIRRRKKGEPVAYILGHKEFFGLDFLVNKNVLIPRPETEGLVEMALKCLDNQFSGKADDHPEVRFSKLDSRKKLKNLKSIINILDLGTGSGCIIISLAKMIEKQFNNLTIEQLKFYTTDVSRKALNLARKNAKKHAVNKKIRFYISDLFSNPKLPKKFNIIIANLPYVPERVESEELKVKSIAFEPHEAIFAGGNGTAVIKRFIDQAKDRIKPGGLVLIELDPRNAAELLNSAKKSFRKANIELKKDLAQLDRFLKIQA